MSFKNKMRWKSLTVFLIIFLISFNGVKGISSSTSTEFSISGYEECVEGGSRWYDENGVERITTVEDWTACYGKDEIAGNADDCCPVGYGCVEGEKPGCVPGKGVEECMDIGSCSDYTTQEDCENDICMVGVAGGRGEGTDICGSVICYDYNGEIICQTIRDDSCRCEWKDGECRLAYDVSESSGGGHKFTCSKKYSSTACVEGRMEVSWVATVEWDLEPPEEEKLSILQSAGCVDGGPVTRMCGRSLIALSFFKITNLIIAILIIGIIYIIWISKKERKKKIKKKKK